VSLLTILDEIGIVSSIDFQYNVRKEEQKFGQVALVLLNDINNNMEFIIQSLIDIVHIKPKQARAMALLAHFKGDATITYGDRDVIGYLAYKFENIGILVGIVPV